MIPFDWGFFPVAPAAELADWKRGFAGEFREWTRMVQSVKRRAVTRRWILFSVLMLVLGVALYFWREERLEKKFLPQISAAARRYGVDPLLVRAVVWRESRFHPEARGTRGEIGLMQIQENSAREWADAEHIQSFAHEACLDPGTNVLAGTFYLGRLLRRYGGADDAVPYALADYNAGRSNVLRWKGADAATNSAVFLEQIGFPSTRSYVKSVLRRYAFYRFLSRAGW
jgi:soluble lytic murein transglycosylase